MLQWNKPVDNYESLLLGRLCHSSEFLGECSNFITADQFESQTAQLVAKWCIEYYAEARVAPGEALRTLFAARKGGIEGADLLSRQIDATLSMGVPKGGSNEYEVKLALDWSRLRQAALLSQKLQSAIQGGNADRAEGLIGSYKPSRRYSGIGVDPSRDFAASYQAFREQEDEALFTLPGVLGNAVGSFKRSDMAAIVAPPKRGKSWCLLHLAISAAFTGNNVLFINLEMRQSQILRRYWQSLLGITKNPGKKQIEIPTLMWEHDGHGKSVRARYQLASTQVVTPVMEDGYLEAQMRAIKMSSKFGRIQFESFPTGTLSVSMLRDRLAIAASHEGFVPDVIVIDYADLMVAETRQVEERHRLNNIWLALRGLSLEFDNCLITASQGGMRTAASDKDIGVGDIAEDSRKLGHVTKLLVLNQNRDEKQAGLARISADVQRDDGTSYSQVVLTQCLDIGAFAMDSCYVNQFERG
jgi:replicative DNA helicase